MKVIRLLGLGLLVALAAIVLRPGGSLHASQTSPATAKHETLASADGMFVADMVGDWTPDAKKGLDLAISALAAQIKPTVPIEIRIEMTQLEPNILGRGGGAGSLRDFPNAPIPGTWYPQSLAHQFIGERALPGPDGLVWLNSIMPWDYSGQPQKALAAKKPDFVTTITHEVLHTMGIQGTARVMGPDDGEMGDDDGVEDPENHMHVMYWHGSTTPGSMFLCAAPTARPHTTNANEAYPDVWDRFVVNGTGEPVLDYFPDPSPDLDDFLQSDDLFWSGKAGMAANKGKPVKLYAPAEWRPGSSYAHLDDGTFDGGEDALMTAAGANIPDTSLGPRLIGILQDIGWKANNR